MHINDIIISYLLCFYYVLLLILISDHSNPDPSTLFFQEEIEVGGGLSFFSPLFQPLQGALTL